ncbi:MAG TPA: hypothetical protein VM307_04065, partial [Egibacteraceae bacterium]|nr:hypothetical protein [Egibacteraceae bacterium]
MANLQVLRSSATVPATDGRAYAGGTVYRAPGGGWLLPAFRNHAVAVDDPLPAEDDDAFGTLILDWVEQVRSHDWTPLRGQTLEGDDDWLDLRTAMVRVGWGPSRAQAAWEQVRDRPYHRGLPTAAGTTHPAAAHPAAGDDAQPLFAQPVLEARGLLRWAYITRWD